MERYERLQTCDDVFALSRGIGESLTLDCKEKLGRRETWRGVCSPWRTPRAVPWWPV
jgi:hypothetical protein